MATTEAIAEGTWQVVNRRRRNQTQPITNTYKPYHTQPTYAAVLKSPPKPSTLPAKPNKPNPRATNLTLLTKSTIRPGLYISPHCSAKLRFPPSPRFVEWKGRCFRCCLMGHNVSQCKNPKKCGKCWGNGYIGVNCKVVPLNLEALPSQPADSTNPPSRSACKEPTFEEFIKGPIISRPLPEGRPEKSYCFVQRDDEYHAEVDKLQRAVIMCNPTLEVGLTIEQVAEYAASTKLVKEKDVSIGIMTKSRYMILLPQGLEPAEFIKAIPVQVWNEGFSFSLWNPLDDATLVIPRFKVLIDLIGVPLDIYRERDIIRATSPFGIYLGTINQSREGDVACWSVALATTNLQLIPHQIAFMVAGLEVMADVSPRTWVHCEMYKEEELTKQRQKFFPPQVPNSSPLTTNENLPIGDDDDAFIGSRKALLAICEGLDVNSLPAGVRAVLNGARSMVVQPEKISDQESQESHETATKDPEASPAADTCLTHAVDAADPSIKDTPNLELQSDEAEDQDVVGNDIIQPTTPRPTPDPQHLLPGANHLNFGNNINSLIQGGYASESASKEVILKSAEIGNTEGLVGAVNTPKILKRVIDLLPNMEGTSCSHDSRQQRSDRCPQPKPSMVLRNSTLQKRKSQEQAREKAEQARIKKKEQSEKKAQLKKKKDGLVEIQISSAHCSNIAEVTGFTPTQVLQVLQEDNEQRAPVPHEENDLDFEQQEYDSRFDLDSEDELSDIE